MFDPGDILAFYGTDWTSRIIRFFTGGPSHVGIIVDTRDSQHRHKQRVLFESTTLDAGDTLSTGKPVSGCQFNAPLRRIGQYIKHGGTVDVWRLVEGRELDGAQRLRLDGLAADYVKREVDYNMAGAILSGTRLFRWTNFLPTNRHQLFCSALVHSMLESISLVSPDNSSRYNPASLIRLLERNETYRRVQMISRDNWSEISLGRLF